MIPLLLMLGVAFAGPQESFDAGVTAERQGDHGAAIEDFVAALDQGARDPAVYHGLGNALYRQGELGRAVAAWSRAHALAPRDGDIVANLDRARHQTRDRIEAPDAGNGAFFWQHWLSTRDSALASGVLLALALFGLLVRRLAKARSGWGWESVVAALLGLLLAASTWAAAHELPGAVIVLPEVAARSALGPGGVDLFLLHEGAPVRVVEFSGDHALIVLPDERKGWVARSSLLSTRPEDPFPLP